MRALCLGALLFLAAMYAVLPAKVTSDRDLKAPKPCQGPTVMRPNSEGQFPHACTLPQWL